MKNLLVVIFCSAMILCGGCAGQKSEGYMVTPINMENEVSDYSSVVDIVRDSVVSVYSTTRSQSSLGSGVCISADGQILTNSHVVLNGGENTVITSKGVELPATLAFRDPVRDIAILKVVYDLPYLVISEDYKVGQTILAIGTPLTLDFAGTVTQGIISAKDRTVEVDGDSGVSYMQGLIQHDASINPGNSGGALIDIHGRLVGINTLKVATYEGLGFAIPAKNIKNLISNISVVNYYNAPYIGILGFDCDHVRANGIKVAGDGLYIASISEDSTAYAAGLKVGDIIKSVNGKVVCCEQDLLDILYCLNPGETLNVEYMRGNKTMTQVLCAKSRY